jgi:hypothetical protein
MLARKASGQSGVVLREFIVDIVRVIRLSAMMSAGDATPTGQWR